MQERRVRKWWVMRERYRWAARVASWAGCLGALLVVAASLRDEGLGVLGSTRYVVMAAALVAAGFLIPRWLVNTAWRLQRAWAGADWQP